MAEWKKIVAITLDNETKSLVDNYAMEHAISRSAAIRFALNEFFLKIKGSI